MYVVGYTIDKGSSTGPGIVDASSATSSCSTGYMSVPIQVHAGTVLHLVIWSPALVRDSRRN